jgi:hypothetical protein
MSHLQHENFSGEVINQKYSDLKSFSARLVNLMVLILLDCYRIAGAGQKNVAKILNDSSKIHHK